MEKLQLHSPDHNRRLRTERPSSACTVDSVASHHLTCCLCFVCCLQVICFAHERNVRVVYKTADLDSSKLASSHYREQWISEQVQMMKDNYADGLNVDFEGPIPQDTDTKGYFTLVIKDLSTRMKSEVPGSQLSIDVGWGPACIDGRCFNVHNIAKYVDLMVVMSYDESSQILGPCIALANSPPIKTFQGLLEYINNGIPRDKLVMGVPWYGYDYPCEKLNSRGECEIKEVPFRGIPCSDSAGKQLDYSHIDPDMVRNSLTGRVWNSTLKTPMFNYKDANGTYHQVWYDDPESLGIKFYYAAKAKLRGLAVWNFDQVSYQEEYVSYTSKMYSAFDMFFNNV